jgi:IS30 family transposase
MPYTHYTREEREMLQCLHDSGRSYSDIAFRIGKHRTAISHELRRNVRANGLLWQFLLKRMSRTAFRFSLALNHKRDCFRSRR